MAVNLPNFLTANTSDYGLGDNLLKSAMQGYMAGRMPAQLRQQEQKALADRLYKELQGKELNQKIDNPALYSSDPLAAVYGLSEFYKNRDNPSHAGNEADIFKGIFDKRLKKQELELTRQEQIVGSNNWNLMTPEQKAHVAAVANRLGIPQTDLNQAIADGRNLYDVAAEHGFTAEDINAAAANPKFLPTTGTVTQGQQQQRFATERLAIGNFVTSGLGMYSDTMAGWSPKQIFDQIKNDNPDKQAHFLAARALSADYSALTAGQLGLPGGIRMMQHIESKALTDIKVMRPFLTAEVYNKFQNLVNEQLQKAFLESRGEIFGTETPEEVKHKFKVLHGDEYKAEKEGSQIRTAFEKENKNNKKIDRQLGEALMSDDEIRLKREAEAGKNVMNQADKIRQNEERNSANMVTVRTPDGRFKFIPKEELAAALKAGGTEIKGG